MRMSRIFTGVALALIAVGAPACGTSGGTADGPFFIPGGGQLFFSQDNNGNGLFVIDVSTGAATLVGAGATATTSNTIGLTETTVPGVLLGSTFSDIATIACDGSSAVPFANSAEAEALAMNPSTGILYGAINGSFFTIDPATGLQIAALPPAPGGADVEGLAADPATNRIYAIVRFAPELHVYDVAANSWSTVGSTGISWLDPGLAYNHLTGVLYAIDANTDQLYTIDPATAATTAVGPLGTNAGGGLAFVVK